MGKCLYIYITDHFHIVLFLKYWKIFPSNFVSPLTITPLNIFVVNISLFKTEGQADEVGEHSEKQ